MTEEHEETSNPEHQISNEEHQTAEPTVESVVEAVLFASDEPLTLTRLANIVGTGAKTNIRRTIMPSE